MFVIYKKRKFYERSPTVGVDRNFLVEAGGSSISFKKKPLLQWTEMNCDIQCKFIAVLLKSQQDNSHISQFFKVVSFILKNCVMCQVS